MDIGISEALKTQILDSQSEKKSQKIYKVFKNNKYY